MKVLIIDNYGRTGYWDRIYAENLTEDEAVSARDAFNNGERHHSEWASVVDDDCKLYSPQDEYGDEYRCDPLYFTSNHKS